MISPSISFEIDTTGMQAKLLRVKKRINTIPWKQAGEIVKQSMHKNFEVGGRYSRVGSVKGGSRKWRARKKKAAWKILRKSGKLQRSFYVSPKPNSVVVGSRGLDYNRAHNLGYSKRKLPARPFLVVQAQDLANVKELVKNHLIS
jgi:phage gpG-like protein